MQGLKGIAGLIALLPGGRAAAAARHVAKAADEASGGHLQRFMVTSDEAAEQEIDASLRDEALRAYHLSNYNAIRAQFGAELIRHLHIRLEAIEQKLQNLQEMWQQYEEKDRPGVRDVISASNVIVDEYAVAPPNRREVLLAALVGSFSPEAFRWGRGDEVLRCLARERLTLEDIGVLRTIARRRDQVVETWDACRDIASYERLARAGFIQLRQPQPQGSRGLVQQYVKSRYEATVERFSATVTTSGSVCINMVDAGSLPPTSLPPTT